MHANEIRELRDEVKGLDRVAHDFLCHAYEMALKHDERATATWLRMARERMERTFPLVMA